jgi:hypothetical protein
MITPTAFTKVDYDQAELAELLAEATRLVPGLPAEFAAQVRIEEGRSTSIARVVAADPWVLEVDGGAVEDTRFPRTVGRDQALVTFGRLLFEIADRVDEGFGAPPIEVPIAPPLRAAWDTYCVGRIARCGVRVHPPRYRYNLRNRLGFSDVADLCFDRLWSSDGLSWSDLEAVVEAAGAGAGR